MLRGERVGMEVTIRSPTEEEERERVYYLRGGGGKPKKEDPRVRRMIQLLEEGETVLVIDGGTSSGRYHEMVRLTQAVGREVGKGRLQTAVSRLEKGEQRLKYFMRLRPVEEE